MRIIGLTKDLIGFAMPLYRLPKQVEDDRRALRAQWEAEDRARALYAQVGLPACRRRMAQAVRANPRITPSELRALVPAPTYPAVLPLPTKGQTQNFRGEGV